MTQAKYADLHVHTFYSDSTFSPEEVVSCAKEQGLAAIAICDHDTVDGIDPCMALGLENGVEIIPGIEMSVEKMDAEIHVLGYFIDWKQEWLRKKLKEIQDSRVERIFVMIEKLKAMGVNIDAERTEVNARRGFAASLQLPICSLQYPVVCTPAVVASMLSA